MAVKRFWRELKMCLDLPITKESAVIVLDKKKVDEVLKNTAAKVYEGYEET